MHTGRQTVAVGPSDPNTPGTWPVTGPRRKRPLGKLDPPSSPSLFRPSPDKRLEGWRGMKEEGGQREESGSAREQYTDTPRWGERERAWRIWDEAGVAFSVRRDTAARAMHRTRAWFLPRYFGRLSLISQPRLSLISQPIYGNQNMCVHAL